MSQHISAKWLPKGQVSLSWEPLDQLFLFLIYAKEWHRVLIWSYHTCLKENMFWKQKDSAVRAIIARGSIMTLKLNVRCYPFRGFSDNNRLAPNYDVLQKVGSWLPVTLLEDWMFLQGYSFICSSSLVENIQQSIGKYMLFWFGTNINSSCWDSKHYILLAMYNEISPS